MKKTKYETLQENLIDTKDILKGRNIFYKCQICTNIVPSLPKDNVCCDCGNICIDKDMNRLWISNYEDFSVLIRISG